MELNLSRSDDPHVIESLVPMLVDVDSLEFMPSNPRTHSDRNLDAIKLSLHRFKQQRPIVVASDGRTVIAGNGTLAAARDLGWTKIAVAVSSLDADSDEARAFAVADNRSTDLSTFDDDIVKSLLDEIDADLAAAAGFNPDEILREFPTSFDMGSDDETGGSGTVEDAIDESGSPDVTIEAPRAPRESGEYQSLLITGPADEILTLRRRLDVYREEHDLDSILDALLEISEGL